ncbi:MAG: acyltransferase [Cytophagia bacterium]|nr:acyltransferase [Cytophagia bacterium]
MSKVNNIRMNEIDSFRCLAVLMVVFFHFYAKFSPPISAVNFLPYQYNCPALIQHGFFGVQFFFIISGFVIFHTLEASKNLGEFFVKRLIRLIPTLVLCMLITFLFQNYLDHDITILPKVNLIDFVPSLTFTPPQLWNQYFNTNDIKYVDTVYWSLYVEMLFYIAVSLLYFFRPKSLTINWLKLTLLLTLVRVICSPKLSFVFPNEIDVILGRIYLAFLGLHLSYWAYFSFGLFFYSMYRGNVTKLMAFLFLLTISLEMFFIQNNILRIMLLAFVSCFLIFVYKPKVLAFLTNKFVLWVGLISYPVYLLHQNIGLILINRMATFDTLLSFKKYFPLMAIFVILAMSGLIYLFYERPIGKALKNRLLR